MIRFLSHITRRLLPAVLAAVALLGLGACAGSTAEDGADGADLSVENASDALNNGDYSRAQQICNDLMADDFDRLSERQLASLAMLYMRLAEYENLDENIAEATRCVGRAQEISTDSLRSVIVALPPEEVPQFVMLMRLSGSIANPPDLSREYSADDSIPAAGELPVGE